jgi:hypothetical protein
MEQIIQFYNQERTRNMSYKVIIIDNKTNEVVINEDNAGAIIGAVSSEEGVHCLGLTDCKATEILSTLEGVDKATDALTKENPKIGLLHSLERLKDLCDLDPIKKN